MDFNLNDMQVEFKETARKFFAEKCTLEHLKSWEKEPNRYSAQLYKEIVDLGFTGLIVPENYGGFGGSLMDLALIVEEAGYVMHQSPLIPTVAYGVSPILNFGTEEQKQQLLPKVVEGSLTVAGAISEPTAHYNVAFVQTTAVNEGDHFNVNGQKLFVPFANSVDYLFTVVRTSGQAGDKDGLTALLIDRNSDGVDVQLIPTISADGLCQVTFSNVTVSAEHVIGAVGNGFAVVEQVTQIATALQCVETVAILRRAVDLTADYVKERHQFNVPIASFQSVQHRLSDMFTIVEGGSLAVYYAFSKLAAGKEAAKELAIAKAWISSEGQKVVTGAHQLHGGMGLDYDYPLQFAFRRYKASQLLLGTPEVHLKKLAQLLLNEQQLEKVPSA
ncbi:MAG: acyl-CoA dehydrogenase family protein [Lysinibacillus sp.]